MMKDIMYMKYLITIVVFFASSFLLFSQRREVNVQPDETGQIGALNRTVRGDTTNAGERIEPENTVYILQRDATYRLNLSVLNIGFPLKIEAEDGTGALPKIIPGVTLEGNSDIPFRVNGDLLLKNIFLTGRDTNGGLQDQIVRIQTEGQRIEIEGCRVDESSQSFVRTDARDAKIYITNSVISRMGTPDDIDNGRVVDDRGNFIDTLVVENNTIYNITSRVVRNGSGADTYMNFCKFDQNTIANVGQRMAEFGPVINFEFTNNIIINPSFLGIGVDRDPFNPDQPDPNAGPATAAIVLDSVSQSILDVAGVPQTATVRNNNVHYTVALINARPESNPAPDDDDLVVSRPTFSETALRFIEDGGFEATNIADTLDFEDPVPDPTLFVQEFWDNFNGTNILSPWNNEGAPFDYSYPGAAPSATASISGGQLGDLNWPLIVFSKDALDELITTAEGLILENSVGNNIGNIAQFAVDSLQRAIDASQLIVDDPGASAQDVEDAINALNDAIDFFFSGLITGQSEPLAGSIFVYPNPSSSFFRIHSEMQPEAVTITALDGREIHRWVRPPADQTYGIARLNQGVYFVLLGLADGSSHTIRIVKK